MTADYMPCYLTKWDLILMREVMNDDEYGL